uniref:BPTI/Kunitz inhibitor domain-containing protein n=1 Tax=Globodera rostochiensis TaxID=31243 RepID=A0A914HNA3_GLORO
MFLARRCSALFCGCKVFVILLLHLFLLGADGEQQQKQQQNDRIEESCFEPRDLGVPCPMDGPGRSKKFYYNHQLGSCQPFIYKGCAGNFNRFETTTECRKACAKSSVKSQEWVLAERCNATHLVPDGHYIECAAGRCPEGHNCYPDSLCCPTKDFVCSLPDDSGTFAEGVPDKPRFAWSADIKSCWRFSYFGAKGNYNNFPTFHDFFHSPRSAFKEYSSTSTNNAAVQKISNDVTVMERNPKQYASGIPNLNIGDVLKLSLSMEYPTFIRKQIEYPPKDNGKQFQPQIEETQNHNIKKELPDLNELPLVLPFKKRKTVQKQPKPEVQQQKRKATFVD